MSPTWLRRWVKSTSPSLKQRVRPRSRTRCRWLQLELLEGRFLLSDWSGVIPNGTVFKNTEDQNIVGDVTVPAGSTLTVQAGTVVRFKAGLSMTVGGTLKSQGTATQPILYTSIRDGAGAGNGDWKQIEFTSTSTGICWTTRSCATGAATARPRRSPTTAGS
jgi:hypothetical protein